MSEATNGPWKWVKEKVGGDDVWTLYGADGVTEVCDDGSSAGEYSKTCNPEGSPEEKANSRLIECAWEMAEMLLNAYSHLSHGGPRRIEVESLLKKTGML